MPASTKRGDELHKELCACRLSTRDRRVIVTVVESRGAPGLRRSRKRRRLEGSGIHTSSGDWVRHCGAPRLTFSPTGNPSFPDHLLRHRHDGRRLPRLVDRNPRRASPCLRTATLEHRDGVAVSVSSVAVYTHPSDETIVEVGRTHLWKSDGYVSQRRQCRCTRKEEERLVTVSS